MKEELILSGDERTRTRTRKKPYAGWAESGESVRRGISSANATFEG